MFNSVNEQAIAARSDDLLREELIRQQESLILQSASRASYRRITKSDDEWSVALIAFSDAVDRYSPDKGEFLPFARMLIRRALIDYYRGQAPHLAEVSTSPFVLEGSEEVEDLNAGERSAYLAVVEQSQEEGDRGLREEIESANEMLKRYGFRFFDLTECSPQQEKTRQECAKAIRYVLKREDLVKELERTRKFPIRTVSAGAEVPRKTLDRYRKYMIMAVLVLHGEYPQLAEYLKFVWKEEDS